ncbi:MAG: hypothetical protein JKY36_08260 [Erythrobacter sp.]|nr:hypothetical protein [Erythrobacter sp.]
MYRIFPARSFAYLVAMLAVGVFLAIELVTDAFGIEVRILAIPGIVWGILLALSFNPIWRPVWAFTKSVPWLPDLNEKVFPDLNGEWDMKLESNWSRQEQLLDAACEGSKTFDPRTCDADELAPLKSMNLKAAIEQSWWSIKITVTNLAADSPIKESKTFIVMPRRKTANEPASLCYFYDQTNDTDNQADDPVFSAAACLTYSGDRDRLEGTFWTARQWRRAINTAGRMVLTR